MKKIFILIGLGLVLLTLTSCSNSLRFRENHDEKGEDISQKEETKTSSNDSKEKSTEADISTSEKTNTKPKDIEAQNIEIINTDNTYTINHEKDGTTYTVSLINDSNYNYTLQLFDAESNSLQSILLGRIPEGVDFMDVNLDGYTDIISNTGGTLNETHELYIWDSPSQNFIKVEFRGFDMLSYFETHEGYIMNWVKDTATYGVIQKLIWDGNILIIESEELYELKN